MDSDTAVRGVAGSLMKAGEARPENPHPRRPGVLRSRARRAGLHPAPFDSHGAERRTGTEVRPQTWVSQQRDGSPFPPALVNFCFFMSLCFGSPENVNERRFFNKASPRR